jgi:hypothetical protein
MRFLRAHTEISSQMASGRPLISNPAIPVNQSYLQLRRSTAVLFNTSVSIFALILHHLRIEIKNLVVVVKGFR